MKALIDLRDLIMKGIKSHVRACNLNNSDINTRLFKVSNSYCLGANTGMKFAILNDMNTIDIYDIENYLECYLIETIKIDEFISDYSVHLDFYDMYNNDFKILESYLNNINKQRKKLRDYELAEQIANYNQDELINGDPDLF